jgi:SAM-dependent methyltransferase
MSTHLYLAELLLRTSKYLLQIGEFIKTLPVAVLRPADMVKWARKRYNRHSAVYNEENDPNQGLTEDEKVLWKHTSGKSPGRMLILGGGGGREVIFFERKGWKLTVVDISEGMLEQANLEASRYGIDLSIIQDDLATFTAPNGSFNAVWTSMYLYSLVLGRSRRVSMLRNIREMLTPDGWLIVSFQFDTQMSIYSTADKIRKFIARITLGNVEYQNGDILFGTLEFRHIFSSESELRAEFTEGGFQLLHFFVFEGLNRGGAVLTIPME